MKLPESLPWLQKYLWQHVYSLDIAGIVAKSEIHDPDDEDDDEEDDDDPEEEVVYLLEGRQLGYGSSAAWANAER
jgi:hypothetical protein